MDKMSKEGQENLRRKLDSLQDGNIYVFRSK